MGLQSAASARRPEELLLCLELRWTDLCQVLLAQLLREPSRQRRSGADSGALASWHAEFPSLPAFQTEPGVAVQ